MAVSAQLQLGMEVNPIYVYDVIELDYLLNRNFDMTTRPSSAVLGGLINVTIRGKKEVQTPFHDWLKDNKVDRGRILIYDSTSTIGSMAGGALPNKSEAIPDVDKLVDASINAMERGGSSVWEQGEAEEDQFDDMTRKELKAYIKEKKYDIKVDTGDTDEDIRNKIRLKESGKADDWSDVTKKSLADDIKKTGMTAAKGAVKAAAKWVLETARKIEFESAYCVSVKETFSNSDKTYPWQMQIGLLCKDIKITGAGVMGMSPFNCKFSF